MLAARGVGRIVIVLALMGGVPALAATTLPEAVIDAYMNKQLAENHYPSLSVGVVDDGKLVFAKACGLADRETKREATPETLYYIGSVTKAFTATLMVQLRDEGKLRLDDPIAQYLPESVKLPTDPRGAPAITFRHLATHTSGLPRLPVNLKPEGEDAYNAYSLESLFAGLNKTPLIDPIGAKYSYSNLGVGLLGQILARISGDTYENLLTKRLLNPLEMRDTVFTMSTEQRARFALGYKGDPQTKAVEWRLGSLTPAGGLVSSVPDLAKFLALQMRAGTAGVAPVSGGTLRELHTPQRLADRQWNMAIGLGWHIIRDAGLGEIVWHNGGVAGHYSYFGFLPGRKIGVIVLGNRDRQVDEIGDWLLHMVAKPATTTRPEKSE
jgi:serine-type D-Ala-D-Ala carboxypeptidase/endopeptidase